jgi:hypothetical protein
MGSGMKKNPRLQTRHCSQILSSLPLASAGASVQFKELQELQAYRDEAGVYRGVLYTLMEDGVM